MKFLFFLYLTLLSLSVASAPIPGTSSSSFLRSDRGLFWSQHGFSVHAGKTSWQHKIPTGSNKSFIETLYSARHSANGVQASLTVRVDKLKEKMSLTRYAHQWKKDYPRLGFNVVLAKSFSLKKEKLFLLDMVNPNTNRQVRQYLFLKNQKAVILTCRDHTATFRSSVESCNRIVRNFSWVK